LLEVDFYHQLLIITIVLGLSSGASTAFSAEYRLAIVYLIVLIFPLIGTLVFTNIYENYILSLALLLYFISEISMIIRIYKKEVDFRALRSEQDILNHLFKEAPLAIFMYNFDLKIIECNEQFSTLFGQDRATMVGLDLHHLSDKTAIMYLTKALHENALTYKGSYTSMSGTVFWIEAKIFSYKNQSNKSMGSIVLIEDKTNEHEIQEELKYFASHDELTGLLNRRGLRNQMQDIFSHEKHEKYYSLLCYIDLNQFKGINDSLGHSIGDDILLIVSRRLRQVLEENVYLSRLGGDEFVVIVPYISKELDITKETTKIYINKITAIFDKPFIIKDLYLHIKASIGVVIIEPNYRNIEEIIRHADITMYHAKNTKLNLSYYDESFDKKQKELFKLQHDLAYAVENKELNLFYQPVVKIKNEKVYSAEALIRWNHPQKGVLAPDIFIALAIKAGILSKITWWVLHEVCRHIKEWKDIGIWNLEYISINVNAQQLIENNFADEFLRILKLYNLNASDIVVEITERSLIDNFDSTQDVINNLRKSGVRCAIDDFGIGYSSLSYLKKLSFYTLKIDREFVKEIETNPKELLLVSTILDIGKQFNYNIVIEGIEDKKQKDLLLGLDEDLSYQGYYFSKPLHADKFREKFLY
jgi:diguanylate cyclase (GGDEF)-like protein/PAS domain S-box-containing protein